MASELNIIVATIYNNITGTIKLVLKAGIKAHKESSGEKMANLLILNAPGSSRKSPGFQKNIVQAAY